MTGADPGGGGVFGVLRDSPFKLNLKQEIQERVRGGKQQCERLIHSNRAVMNCSYSIKEANGIFSH